MKAIPTEILWHAGMPIFASEKFLKVVSDEYGWIGGVDDAGHLRCVLPYTIIRKLMIRIVRFRVEIISLGNKLSVNEEKAFLNNAVKCFHSMGVDMIIPATTNTIFSTYPDGAIAAPYGSYVIDLDQSEESLWNNIHATYRRNIRSAIKSGVQIHNGINHIDTVYDLIRGTFKRSSLGFMSNGEFKRQILGLGDNVSIKIAYYQGVAQSCTVYPFSDYCAYAVYGGNILDPARGAMKLLQWDAIRMFSQYGVKRFDFVGARINPEAGSKQEGITIFKQCLGGKLVKGYMWKYPFNRLTYGLYSLATRLQRGGDIVDHESHKLTPDSVNGHTSC